MSYRVEYDANLKWENKQEEWGIRRVVTVLCFFVLLLLAVNLFWAEGRDVLLQLVLPGDSVITWNSLTQLSDRLQEGIPLWFAAREFCNEVLQSCY